MADGGSRRFRGGRTTGQAETMKWSLVKVSREILDAGWKN